MKDRIIVKYIISNENYYDCSMIQERLNINRSVLQNLMNQYHFNSNDYVVYKNRFLYSESSLVNFIEHILKRKSKKIFKLNEPN